jgi:ferritin
MLSEKVKRAMNQQLQRELQSAYVYLAMSAYAEAEGLSGMAQWLRLQSREEISHAMKFYDFILDRGSRMDFEALDAPLADYKSPLQVFEQALAHERKVTQSINDIYKLVAEEWDFASQAWLNWFALEQVEEEKSVEQIVDDLKRVGAEGYGLYSIDKDLATRSSAAD